LGNEKKKRKKSTSVYNEASKLHGTSIRHKKQLKLKSNYLSTGATGK